MKYYQLLKRREVLSEPNNKWMDLEGLLRSEEYTSELQVLRSTAHRLMFSIIPSGVLKSIPMPHDDSIMALQSLFFAHIASKWKRFSLE